MTERDIIWCGSKKFGLWKKTSPRSRRKTTLESVRVARYWARREHAWLLRAEGRKFGEIGKLLGTDPVDASWLMEDFGEHVAEAISQANWSWLE